MTKANKVTFFFVPFCFKKSFFFQQTTSNGINKTFYKSNGFQQQNNQARIMELPQIVQDDKALKSELVDLIQQRYELSANESRFNFEAGQLNFIKNMSSDDSLVKNLHNLLQLFLKNRVENGYCYFTLKSILQSPSLDKDRKIKQIAEEARTIQSKISKYNKINHLILMREILLGKFEDKTQISKQVLQFIDDIRFITQEVVNAIRSWKRQLDEKGLKNESIIYIYKNYNYVTKIIVDNSAILNNFNKKTQIFFGSPNPFFLMVNSKVTGISIDKINRINQILAEEKGLELKMMIESPYLKALKNVQLQNELKKLRNKIEDDKIKTIYKPDSTNTKLKIAAKILSTYQERYDNIVVKNQESIKQLNQLIKVKQIQILKEMKKGKMPMGVDKKDEKDPMKKSATMFGYKNKLQNLRSEVQKNIKINKQKQKRKSPLPKAEAELKTPKPKIKIVCERQSAVENTAKGIFDMIAGQSKEHSLTRSRSTFYKQIKIDDKGEEGGQSIVKNDRNFMINSAYSFKSLPQNKKVRSTSINFKMRKTSAKKVKKEGDNSKNQSREQKITEVNQSLAVLNTKIREQSIKNIYSNRAQYSKTTAGFKRNNNSRSIEKDLSLDRKQQNKDTSRVENVGSSVSYTVEDKLKQKEKHIEQLKEKLKSLRSNKNTANTSVQPEQKKLEPEPELSGMRQTEVNKFKEEKEKLELQNIRIQEQMKMEELKYLSLKEQEYKLKQSELENIYSRKIDKIKEDLLKQQKQFQERIAEQKKKNDDMESKFKEVAKESQHIKIQLQEKQIKEQLFSQLMQEEAARRAKEEEEKEQEERNFVMMEEFKIAQEKYKNQLEKKAMEIFEEEKLKLKTIQMDIQKKNQYLEAENRKKQEQIQRIQAEKLKEEEKLQKLQLEIEQKNKQLELAEHLKKDQIVVSAPVQPTSDPYQLEQLKERVKLELLEELKKKREQEEEDERVYQQTRKKHLEELQEQMRKAMKIEDEQLQQIEEQYRIKNEEMLRQYEEDLRNKQREKELIEQESQKRLQRLEYKEPFQLEKLVNIETGVQGYGEDRKQQAKEVQKEKEEVEDKEQKQIQKKEQPEEVHHSRVQKKEEEKIQENKQDEREKQEKENVEQKPEETKEIEQEKPLIKLQKVEFTKQEQKVEQPQKEEQKPEKKEEPKRQPQTESPSKMPEQPSKVTQTVKQNTEQIKTKYDKLLSLVSKPIKQLFMTYQQSQIYVNKYYSLLQPEVKEMLPFNKSQLQALFRSKRVDIFDNYSFGWFRAKQKKFMLLGSFEAIPLIGAKYGQIQIQQVFIFNKGNAYQKQFLSKLIKIYEKIGYIYQKKTNQQNKYSIKFIVKVPKDINKQGIVSDNLDITATLIFQEHNEDDEMLMKGNCVYYNITQGLSELLNEEQKLQIAGRQDFQSKYINKKMNDQPLNNHIVTTQKLTDKITEVKLSIPINYLQTEDQSFYSIKAIQYEIPTSKEKLFVSFYKDDKIAVVVHQMQPDDVPREFNLDNFVQAKLKKMDQDQQVQLFLPLWSNNINYKGKGKCPKSFSYKQVTRPNLAYGSLIYSRVRKGDFVYLEPPFAFLVFQLNSADMLRRIVFGHIVTQSEVVKTKRMASTA